MTESIKILLGSEDVVIRDNEDAFLNIELSRSGNEIKPDNVKNDFDLGDQYVKERNNSLKFCIYGTMESKYYDCTNIVMTVKTSNNDVLITPKKAKGAVSSTSHFITTVSLSKNGSLSRNIYGNEKGAYSFLFEIDRVALENRLASIRRRGQIPKTDKVILSINDTVKNVFDIIEIPFIFYDENGDFIPYGTKTTDVDVDGNLTAIDNDFPFFYDRHWIKTNISPSKLPFVSFVPPSGIISVPENIGVFSADVSLDFPSLFGRESLTVVIDNDETIRNPNADFVFSPQVIKWAVGEKTKKFTVPITNDLFVEGSEKVTFKLTNIFGAQLNAGVGEKLTIDIQNDDIPSQARFSQNAIVVSESAKTATFEVVFDKPIEVPGQSIDIAVASGTGTTALVGVDFSLGVPGRPGVTNRTYFLKEGDTGITISIDILDDFGYELDKTVSFILANPTQNVAVSGRQGDALTLTITDSMIKKFTGYVFPADFQSGTGAFRVNRKIPIEQYEWRLSSNDGAFTNSFPFSMEVTNLGETVVFDGKIFNKGDIIFSKQFSTGMTEPLVLDLPANDTPNLVGKFFENTKYGFKFVDIQSNVNIQIEGPNVFNDNKYDDVPVVFEVKPAGELDKVRFHLVSEIQNIMSSYDKTNNGCFTNITNALSNIKINGVGFLPKSTLIFNPTAYAQATKIVPYFRSKPIQNHCSFNGQVLPFGFGPAANAPYAQRFIDLSFRDMFVQVGKASLVNSKLLLESRQSVNPDSSAFFNWNNASLNFKNDIEMHITNLGTNDVKILGRDAGIGDTIIIRQSDISDSFSGLNLRLEGNSSYSLSANSFNEATYTIAFKNINFYNKDEQATGDSTEISIKPFKFPASAITQSIPSYVLISRFDDVDVRTNSNNLFSCGGTTFGVSKTVEMKGMLFTNSKTDFATASFIPNNQDITPTCPTDVFQFKII